MVSDIRSKVDKPRRRSTSDRSPATKRRYRESSDKRVIRRRHPVSGRSNRSRSSSSSSSRSASKNRKRRPRKTSNSSASDSSSSSRSSSSSSRSSGSDSSSRSPSVRKTRPSARPQNRPPPKNDQKRPIGRPSDNLRRGSPEPISSSNRRIRDSSKEPFRKKSVDRDTASRSKPEGGSSIQSSSTKNIPLSPKLLPPIQKPTSSVPVRPDVVKPSRDVATSEDKKRKYISTHSDKSDRVSDNIDARKKPTKVIRISNLSRNINEGHLTEIFSNYGTVVKVDLPLDQVLQLPRGFAYVEMKTVTEMEEAFQCLDGGQIDGLCCSVLPHHGIIDHDNKDGANNYDSHEKTRSDCESSTAKPSSNNSGTKRRRRGSIGSSTSSQESAGEN